ncbi:MAG: extensin family protein [Alphaproteobacteria bacterium]|nr:extensin family protein [Alphaproteobacteria bacterium]
MAALVFGSVMPVDAAPKSPQGAKTAKIPLPELAPWHNRPAALGPGPNGMKRAEPVSKTQKTGKKTEPAKAATNDKAAATEPSVTTLVAPDPNAWTDDDISESLKACVAKLASIQARVEISEPFRKGACGAPAAVEVKKLGTKYPITMSPPAVLRCDMAVALYKFVEESLQPAAVAVLGSPIVSFNGIGSYQCRNRNGDPGGKLSEHALANALDVGTFKLANGASVKVVSDWGPTVRDTEKEQPADSVVQPVAGGKQASGPVRLASLDGKEISRRELRRLRRDAKKGKGPSIPPPPIKKSDALKAVPAKIATAAKAGAPPPGKKPQAATKPARIVKAAAPKETSEMRFLKRVHSEACRYFGTVLGPEANEAHRDHFHFDMAPRNRSNYCK